MIFVGVRMSIWSAPIGMAPFVIPMVDPIDRHHGDRDAADVAMID
jgi:hypothetical protein